MANFVPTERQVREEIIKCGRDPVYFLRNYAKIVHPVRGLIPFKTYDFQDDLLESFRDYRLNIVLKSRQLGISTLAAGYAAWLMAYHKQKNILVMATKLDTATNLVKKTKLIFDNTPSWILPHKVKIRNKLSIELSNGSIIKASTKSEDAGRSEALSLLILDEAAFIDNMEDIWKGVKPTITTGGRLLAVSTPNGVGNWFHQTYVDGEAGKNDFHTSNLHWSVHPDRDDAWFEKETRNMKRRDVAQEYECNFNMSGMTVIDPTDIEYIETKLIKEPTHRAGFDRNLWIWEPYDPNYTYLLVADVARGDGADYSVFHIINLQTLEIVAEYQGKPTPDLFSEFLNQVGREYGHCMIVVENNSYGYGVLEKLINLAYPSLYWSIKSTHEYVDAVTAETMSNAVPGFTTSSGTRPLIVSKLEEFIRNKLIKTPSSRFLNELKVFVWKEGAKPEAMRGYNDDLVMALAIGCWIRDTALVANQREIEYQKAMLGSVFVTSRTLETRIAGMEGYRSDHKKMKERSGQADIGTEEAIPGGIYIR